MTDEMEALGALRDFIAAGLSAASEAAGRGALGIYDDGVTVAFPDPDRMRHDLMAYIEPDSESLEGLTVRTDLARMTASVYLLAKGAREEDLVRTVFDAYTALWLLVRSDPTLGGAVARCALTGMEYYPRAGTERAVVAVEAAVELQWAKEC